MLLFQAYWVPFFAAAAAIAVVAVAIAVAVAGVAARLAPQY